MRAKPDDDGKLMRAWLWNQASRVAGEAFSLPPLRARAFQAGGDGGSPMGDKALMRFVCESLCGDVMRIAELVQEELKSPTRPQTSDAPVARHRTFEELSRARDSIYDAKAKIEKALAVLEPRYMPHQSLPRAAYEGAMRVAEAAIEQSPKAPVIAFDQPPNNDEP
jgi:hypothetical protein